jgi:hypothetical protein
MVALDSGGQTCEDAVMRKRTAENYVSDDTSKLILCGAWRPGWLAWCPWTLLILIVSGTTLALSSEAQVDKGLWDVGGQTCGGTYVLGPEAQANDGALDAGDQAYDDVMSLLYIAAQFDDEEFVRDTEEQDPVEGQDHYKQMDAYDVVEGSECRGWRALCALHGPGSRGRQLARMQQLLRPTEPEQTAHTVEAAERWEYDVRQYETGKEPISCRWRDANKGDTTTIEVRGRLIARLGTNEHLAETPPLGLVQFAVSRAATRMPMGGQRILLGLDAKRAFLDADAWGATYVMPPHPRRTGKCWKLKKRMYDSLPAATGWQKKAADVDEAMNTDGRKTTPCVYLPESARPIIRGTWRRLHQSRTRASHRSVRGSEHEARGARLQGATRQGARTHREDHGDSAWVAEPRHAELAIQGLGLAKARARRSPCGAKTPDGDRDIELELMPSQPAAPRRRD